MIQGKQFLYIIGAERSGTTWLQAMLGAHPAVCTQGELHLFIHYVIPWMNSWELQMGMRQSGIFDGLPMVWSQEEFHAFLREFLRQAYDKVLSAKPGASIILDKDPGNAMYTDLIDRLIPNAKFIHIIRDGRDVSASLLAASKGWGSIWAPRDIESAAKSWKKFVLGAKKASGYTDRYMEVRYEDFLTNGPETLKTVFDFVGIQASPEEITEIYDNHRIDKMRQKKAVTSKFPLPEGFLRKGKSGDWRESLRPAERYLFQATAGDLLSELGYAKDSWWTQKWHERFTLPLLSAVLAPGGFRRKAGLAARFFLGSGLSRRIRVTGTLLMRRGAQTN